MKTFLQIVEDAWLESGLSGSAPSDVANCTGIQRRFVGWVRQAWRDVQEYRRDWPWMRKDISFTTSAGNGVYTPGDLGRDDVESWVLKGASIYKVSEGAETKKPIATTTYEKWIELYSYGPNPQGIPAIMFVRPTDRALMLHPVPDGECTVSLRYQTQVVDLTTNTDTPAMPTNGAWKELIKWRALYYYAFHDGNIALLDESDMEYSRMIHALDNRYGGDIFITGGPIA